MLISSVAVRFVILPKHVIAVPIDTVVCDQVAAAVVIVRVADVVVAAVVVVDEWSKQIFILILDGICFRIRQSSLLIELFLPLYLI